MAREDWMHRYTIVFVFMMLVFTKVVGQTNEPQTPPGFNPYVWSKIVEGHKDEKDDAASFMTVLNDLVVINSGVKPGPDIQTIIALANDPKKNGIIKKDGYKWLAAAYGLTVYNQVEKIKNMEERLLELERVCKPPQK
jgi:hypothetical protein